MKTIILIAKNIRYYYRCSRPVFLLFAAGMLCASLLLIYLYGNISPSVREFSSDDLYSRKYVFRSAPSRTRRRLKSCCTARQRPKG